MTSIGPEAVPSSAQPLETPLQDPTEASFEVLDGADPAQRRRGAAAWDRAGQRDLFAHPDYVHAVANEGERPMCAVMALPDGAEVYYAFIIRPITHDAAGAPLDEELHDLYTPLVYGGPLAAGVDEEGLAAFWAAMREWAHEHGIVSEIIRFTPVDRHRPPYPGTMREQAPHIVVDLDGFSEEDVIAALHKSVRRRYRKALEVGMTLRVVRDESGIDDFVTIHAETMRRRDAHEKFHVGADFLRMVHGAVPGQVVYVFADLDGVPQSVEMVVFRDDSSYAYLAGTLTEALSGNSTTLAAVGAMLVAREGGSREHNLAGGITNTVEDSLLHFKRGFTRGGDRAYYTGEQVFLPEVYERLCAPAQEHRAESTFFPFYRSFSRRADGHAVPEGDERPARPVGDAD
jgi:hypothetical protein